MPKKRSRCCAFLLSPFLAGATCTEEIRSEVSLRDDCDVVVVSNSHWPKATLMHCDDGTFIFDKTRQAEVSDHVWSDAMAAIERLNFFSDDVWVPLGLVRDDGWCELSVRRGADSKALRGSCSFFDRELYAFIEQTVSVARRALKYST